jgi:hypothetical protein
MIKFFQKELKQHSLDYLLLFTGGIFFLLSLNLFRGERLLEFIVLLAFVSFYIIWGVYHHLVIDKFHFKIVLEYIMIGFILLFLLKIIILP